MMPTYAVPIVLPSFSHALPSIVTFGASALTLSVPLGDRGGVPAAAGHAAGEAEVRRTRRRRRLGLLAGQDRGDGPVADRALEREHARGRQRADQRRARRGAGGGRCGDRDRRYGFVLAFHARNLYGR